MLRAQEVRHFSGLRRADEDDPAPWLVAILEGVPRNSAEVSFELSYVRPDDFAEAAKLLPNAEPNAAWTPRVTVFFGARNVLAEDRSRRETMPMRAQGLSLGSDGAAAADVQAILLTNTVGKETVRVTPTKTTPFALPANGTLQVRVRREAARAWWPRSVPRA